MCSSTMDGQTKLHVYRWEIHIDVFIIVYIHNCSSPYPVTELNNYDNNINIPLCFE